MLSASSFFVVTRARASLSLLALSPPLFLSPLQGTRKIKLSGFPSFLFTENGGPGLASVADALSRARGGVGLRDDGVREVRH